jgi:hypothetical protein
MSKRHLLVSLAVALVCSGILVVFTDFEGDYDIHCKMMDTTYQLQDHEWNDVNSVLERLGVPFYNLLKVQARCESEMKQARCLVQWTFIIFG